MTSRNPASSSRDATIGTSRIGNKRSATPKLQPARFVLGAGGALEPKIKELMAMAIGVVHGCDGCIASHARGAVRNGASKQEAADAIGVAILMHGGPGTVYGARAYAAFCEFADAAAAS